MSYVLLYDISPQNLGEKVASPDHNFEKLYISKENSCWFWTEVLISKHWFIYSHRSNSLSNVPGSQAITSNDWAFPDTVPWGINLYMPFNYIDVIDAMLLFHDDWLTPLLKVCFAELNVSFLLIFSGTLLAPTILYW